MKAAKLIAAVLLATLLLQLAPMTASGATSAPSRVIHVVYDDSLSMIYDDASRQWLDTWCQAKYAMEVFAAMLGEKDSMSIYYMSDFDNYNMSAGPRLQLYGRNGAASNVKEIHELLTTYNNTPFNTVRRAYADLEAASGDEKWLVVLTDGAFQDLSYTSTMVDSFFAAKRSDIKVMFLGMGPKAGVITENQSQDIYYKKAETNSQILREITDICTQIFNSDRLEVNVSAKTVEFDVPMGELTVFAQGANVVIEGITDSSGKTYQSSTAPVVVQYSEVADTRYADRNAVDRNLKGSIAIFKDDFPAGRYRLEVSGADTIEVYYKPNVEIAAYLMDADGNEVTDRSSLHEGDYTVRFGLVKAGTQERVGESALLGTVTYSARLTVNGQTSPERITSGSVIHLPEGVLELEATAEYLRYNTVNTYLRYQVFSDKDVGFNTLGSGDYRVTNAGADFSDPIRLQMQVAGGITDEQWRSMPLPEVDITSPNGRDYGPFRVEKDREPGVFLLWPTLEGEPKPDIRYEGFDFRVDFSGSVGEALWQGSMTGHASVTDVRTRAKGLALSESPVFRVTRNGLETPQPIRVQVAMEGEQLSEAEWRSSDALPVVELSGPNAEDYTIRVEKDGVPGVYLLWPGLKENLSWERTYGGFDYAVTLGDGSEGSLWQGELSGHAEVEDVRARVTGLKAVSEPAYTVTTEGLQGEEPILIRASFSGEPLTQEEWENLPDILTELSRENGGLYGDFRLEKSDEIGVWRAYPTLKPGLMSYKEYDGFDYSARYEGGEGALAWDGTMLGRVKVSEGRSWLERNMQLVIRVGIIAAILLFILGYIPPVKKYLPRKLKSHPTVNCNPNRRGIHAAVAKGQYQKNRITTLIPYKAETGSIKFVPSGVPGTPRMQVKAAGGNGMWVTNVKPFAGKSHISFNGAPVEEGRNKPLRVSAGVMITVSTRDMTYVCIPNQ